jgi:hypothetical protein
MLLSPQVYYIAEFPKLHGCDFLFDHRFNYFCSVYAHYKESMFSELHEREKYASLTMTRGMCDSLAEAVKG